MLTLLDGKSLSEQILSHIQAILAEKKERPPGLAFVLVGDHPPSHAYVRMKKLQCAKVGMHSLVHEYPADISEKELLSLIHKMNQDPKIDGILVQQPLPSHLSSQKIVEAVLPEKDVDGFHPLNIGKLLIGDSSGFVPCTPLGIQKILLHYQIPTQGKHVVIVGRSNIVGKPLAALLLQKGAGGDATVTIAHSQSQDLPDICKRADILVAAIGKAHFIQPTMVKKGAVVIDVGINRLDNGTIVGDVDTAKVSPLCSAITPVPGGVGPMTIACLLLNTLKNYLMLDKTF